METHEVCIPEKGIKGYGDYFSDNDLEMFSRIYYSYKDLNSLLTTMGSRRSNLPEILSEGLCCYLLGLYRTNNVRFIGLESSSFDCIDPVAGTTYQIKAVSTLDKNSFGGPTSFGPRSESDKLLLAHFICNDDVVVIYEYTDDINDFYVNKKETFAQQCAQGKRPRFSLLKETINKGITPIKVFSWRYNEGM